jgi:6-phosphogluconolactonase
MDAAMKHEPREASNQLVRWHPYADIPALEHAAVERILAAAATALRGRGQFNIVLAGGRTPRGVYQRLRKSGADFGSWQIYFGDERCVARNDAGRNSLMAAQAWFDAVGLGPAQVHTIPAERGAYDGARAYAALLQGVPEFDLVLLGLGEDGHTASLFPNHEWGVGPGAPDTIAVLDAPKDPPHRVSLSAARLSRAKEMLFLVDGAAKRQAVAAWRNGANIPARSITPAVGVDVLIEATLLT